MIALLLALALALHAFGSPVRAQPGLIESDPAEGDFLEAPPGETTAPEETLQPDGPMGQEGDEDDVPDILLKALITTAVIGGAAVLTTLLYLVRRSIGFEPHRPPEDDKGEGGEQ